VTLAAVVRQAQHRADGGTFALCGKAFDGFEELHACFKNQEKYIASDEKHPVP